jgi:cation transporter-like permease
VKRELEARMDRERSREYWIEVGVVLVALWLLLVRAGLLGAEITFFALFLPRPLAVLLGVAFTAGITYKVSVKLVTWRRSLWSRTE